MDVELKKAFSEMQMNKIETTKKIRVLDSQIDALKKSVQRYNLTEKEIGNLSNDTKVYSAVGRIFVGSSISEVNDDLKVKQKKIESVVDQCVTSKDLIIKRSKEQEDGLRDLVQQKKEAK
ncbi:unnamed protein product [Diamesa hyperborea]